MWTYRIFFIENAHFLFYSHKYATLYCKTSKHSRCVFHPKMWKFLPSLFSDFLDRSRVGTSAAAKFLEEAALPQGWERNPTDSSDSRERHSIHMTQQIASKIQEVKEFWMFNHPSIHLQLLIQYHTNTNPLFVKI